tara:strand:+ start:889 stop:1449 length:561 start_codon:yes stop_codon:yes gene_type:complete
MPDANFQIQTQRLRLVAMTPGLLRLQTEDRAGFFEALNVAPEFSWPPELVDDSAMQWLRDRLDTDKSQTGWHFWAFIWPGSGGQPDRLVGGGGFKGPPDENGEVEIGYSMLISFREQGLATEAVEGLLDWARQDDRVKRVIAKTLPHLTASRRVLEKTGFSEAGEREEDGNKIVVYTRSLEHAQAA